MTMLGKREAGAGAGGGWRRDGVLFQVYPRSFADSDGDGIGDLRGLIDHLEWLGIDGVWLSPTFSSPDDDVTDCTAVHPDLGTLEDVDELIAAAARRGIRILLDLVRNHTGEGHPWLLGGSAWELDDASGRYHPAQFLESRPDRNWCNEDGREAFDDVLRSDLLVREVERSSEPYGRGR
jgi:glycosidase